jgi:pyridoxal phosphate enzyme (YggS family)
MGTAFLDSAVKKNFLEVCDRIATAAESAGRDPQQVQLVVVTKSHPVEAVLAALDAGASCLGENYTEEGIAKMQALSSIGRPAGQVSWHMIGHIQSRKAEEVVRHYDWLHSLDSLKLAHRLDRFAAEFGKRLPALLECNVSGEESKFGWPASRPEAWDRLLPGIDEILSLNNVEVCGLMTMAPFLPDPEEARPFFQRLVHLRDWLASRFQQAHWDQLSMGMSADYEVAVQEGATLVRVGTAILGPRPD